MYSNRANRMGIRNAVCTALAASLVAGTVIASPLAMAGSSSAEVGKEDYSADKDLRKAEKAVASKPNDGSLRLELANAYLSAGRFDSAATTFEDAMALGESSPSTALSLAISYIAVGRDVDARALLGQWRDSISASDFGLAVALSGETSRGVAILTDAVRSSDTSPKLRQNLAYAYALDGLWLEARLMVAQDIPANMVDERISDWASRARPDDYRARVAGLIGAPVRADSGQPEFLALQGKRSATTPVLADASSATSPVFGQDSSRELPAVESGESFWGVENKAPVAMLPDTKAQVAAPPQPTPAGDQHRSEAAAMVPEDHYVARSIVQPVPEKQHPKPLPEVQKASARHDSTHLVQLGSFSSRENAERAWKIYLGRYPTLEEGDLRITEAIVRGKHYWRVAAAGFDRKSASAMCSTVKGGGHGCIAYAASRPLPGALPSKSGSGPMMARR